MSTATHPAPTEIPASRIMRERDQLRAENERLRSDAKRDVEQNLFLKARLDQQKSDYDLIAKHLRDKIRNEREVIANLLENDAIGRDCGACEGTGELPETRFNGYADKWTGSMTDCDDCYSGRVVR